MLTRGSAGSIRHQSQWSLNGSLNGSFNGPLNGSLNGHLYRHRYEPRDPGAVEPCDLPLSATGQYSAFGNPVRFAIFIAGPIRAIQPFLPVLVICSHPQGREIPPLSTVPPLVAHYSDLRDALYMCHNSAIAHLLACVFCRVALRAPLFNPVHKLYPNMSPVMDNGVYASSLTKA